MYQRDVLYISESSHFSTQVSPIKEPESNGKWETYISEKRKEMANEVPQQADWSNL
ncbi:hypothetical protein ACTXT7_002997 [Hymenolepis weldensis]